MTFLHVFLTFTRTSVKGDEHYLELFGGMIYFVVKVFEEGSKLFTWGTPMGRKVDSDDFLVLEMIILLRYLYQGIVILPLTHLLLLPPLYRGCYDGV